MLEGGVRVALHPLLCQSMNLSWSQSWNVKLTRGPNREGARRLTLGLGHRCVKCGLPNFLRPPHEGATVASGPGSRLAI